MTVIGGEKTGGYIGYFVSLPLLRFFDFSVSLIALVGIAIVSVLIMLNMPLSLKSLWRKNKENEGSELQINKMESVAEEKEKNGKEGGEGRSRREDKKAIIGKKGKNNDDEEEILDIKTDLKKAVPTSPLPVKFA